MERQIRIYAWYREQPRLPLSKHSLQHLMMTHSNGNFLALLASFSQSWKNLSGGMHSVYFVWVTFESKLECLSIEYFWASCVVKSQKLIRLEFGLLNNWDFSPSHELGCLVNIIKWNLFVYKVSQICTTKSLKFPGFHICGYCFQFLSY